MPTQFNLHVIPVFLVFCLASTCAATPMAGSDQHVARSAVDESVTQAPQPVSVRQAPPERAKVSLTTLRALLPHPGFRQLVIHEGVQRCAVNAVYMRERHQPQSWASISPVIACWPLDADGQGWTVTTGGLVASQARVQWVLGDQSLYESRVCIPSLASLAPAEAPHTSPLQAFLREDPEVRSAILDQDPDQSWAMQAVGFLIPAAQYWLEHKAMPPTLGAAFEDLHLAVNEESLNSLLAEYPHAEIYQLKSGGYAIHLPSSPNSRPYLVFHEVSKTSGSVIYWGKRAGDEAKIAALLQNATSHGPLSGGFEGVAKISSKSLVPVAAEMSEQKDATGPIR